MHRIAQARDKKSGAITRSLLEVIISLIANAKSFCWRTTIIRIQKNLIAKLLGECKNLLRVFLAHFITHEKARG